MVVVLVRLLGGAERFQVPPEPRGYGGAQLPFLSLQDSLFKSLSKLDGELAHGCTPRNRWIFPFYRDISQGHIDQFYRRFIVWKVATVIDHFAQLHVQALNGVGRVDHRPDLLRVANGMTSCQLRFQLSAIIGYLRPSGTTSNS